MLDDNNDAPPFAKESGQRFRVANCGDGSGHIFVINNFLMTSLKRKSGAYVM